MLNERALRSVEEAFVGILRRRHPDIHWSVGPRIGRTPAQVERRRPTTRKRAR